MHCGDNTNHINHKHDNTVCALNLFFGFSATKTAYLLTYLLNKVFLEDRIAKLSTYTQGEVTSHNLWQRYDLHFVCITRPNALS